MLADGFTLRIKNKRATFSQRYARFLHFQNGIIISDVA